MSNPFLLFSHQVPVSKHFLCTFFIDYLYQCSSRCLPWRLEPTPELAHLYSDQCQGFARTIRTRLYYGCMYSLFYCVLCDYVKGGRAGLIQRSIRYCCWYFSFTFIFIFRPMSRFCAHYQHTPLLWLHLFLFLLCLWSCLGGYYFRNQQYIVMHQYVANLSYFEANLHPFWCTFKGLANAVVYQNWQI